MKKFILTANSARKALIDGNPFEIANFAKKAGSNITLNDKKVSFGFKKPWDLVAHTARRARPPNLWTRPGSNGGPLQCQCNALTS